MTSERANPWTRRMINTASHRRREDLLNRWTVVGHEGRRFKLGTGFSDAQRARPPAIGSWVTYRYNGTNPGGVPRFARFMRE